MFTPHINVKLNVFYAGEYHPWKTEEDDVAVSVFSSLMFQWNGTKRTVVDGHPFWVRYEYPKVDILYDNSTKDLLASLNISADDETQFEVRETQLNELGYVFTVQVEKEVQSTSKTYQFGLDNYRNLCGFVDMCKHENLSETTVNAIKNYLDNLDITKLNSNDTYTIDEVDNITFKYYGDKVDHSLLIEATVIR